MIAISGNNKNAYFKKNISKYLEEKLNDREIITEKSITEIEFIDGLKEKYSYTITPIITNGDVIGSVIIFSENENINDTDVKLASFTANFLGKHIEE